MKSININATYTGTDLLIAQKCDDGNGFLEEENGEISIFNQAKQEFEDSENSEVTIKGIRYYYNCVADKLMQIKDFFQEQHTEEPDALRVDNTKEIIAAEGTVKYAVNEEKQDSEEYAQIRQVVIIQLVKRCPGISKLEDFPPVQREKMVAKVDYVTDVVAKLCEKYQIDELAPVVADMLGNETGGYNFSSKVLQHPGSKYKGCMQVDFLTCQCIFSEGPQKNKDWHNKHFSQDDTQIEELRAKYNNAKNLYRAIQTDIALGLEVGIIAFKAKLHESKGAVSRAIAKYCGSQYKFPYAKYPEVPTQFNLA